MPYLAKRPCSYPGCPSIGQCPVHTKLRLTRQEVNRRHDATRGTFTQRGYGYRWTVRRAAYLKMHPFCVVCGQRGTVVDHITPKRLGGSDMNHNLQALCATCHNRKTGREKRK
jgi:5-methylcytosine-specific restriction protein A